MNNDQIPNNVNLEDPTLNPVPAPLPPQDGMGAMNVAPQGVVDPLINNGGVNPAPPEVVPQVPVTPETVVTPSAPIAPEVATPQPLPNVNLQPEGVVQTPQVAAAPEPSVSPLMSTPLTSDTMLNPQAPATPAPGMPQGPQAPVPPSNMMGVPVPPQTPTQPVKEKKPMNKNLLIILVFVLVLAIGGGVWYVLFGSRTKASAVVITPFVERVELGAAIDTTSAASFAQVSGMSASECSVTTDLDVNKANTYEYTITCGNEKSGPHKVEVSDSLGPVVTVKEVVVVPNAEIEATDFIDTIEDASIDKKKIDAKFTSEVSTLEEGTFEVSIEVKDLYDNSTTVIGKLIVDVNAPVYYLSCPQDSEEENESLLYRFGINEIGSIYNAYKKVIFSYNDDESYQEAVSTYNTQGGIGDATGEAVLDSEKRTITFSSNLKVENLPKEFDTEFFSEEFDIQDVLGGVCTEE